jgi:hypothetical protein
MRMVSHDIFTCLSICTDQPRTGCVLFLDRLCIQPIDAHGFTRHFYMLIDLHWSGKDWDWRRFLYIAEPCHVQSFTCHFYMLIDLHSSGKDWLCTIFRPIMYPANSCAWFHTTFLHAYRSALISQGLGLAQIFVYHWVIFLDWLCIQPCHVQCFTCHFYMLIDLHSSGKDWLSNIFRPIMHPGKSYAWFHMPFSHAYWNHMMKSCETSCKQVAQDTWPSLVFFTLPYHPHHHSPAL